MSRKEGSFKLSSNIEPRAAAPLDARTVVPTLADLTASGAYPYPYVGMIVSVQDTGKAYILTASDTTVLANWKELGAGGGGGGSYTAGYGIDITNDIISANVDDESINVNTDNELEVNEKYKTAFIGTTAQWSALTSEEKAKFDLVDLIDDLAGGAQPIVDEVTEGNMNAVTSNAVAEAIENFSGGFVGTMAEWNALTTDQKKAYKTADITDDEERGTGAVTVPITRVGAPSGAVVKAYCQDNLVTIRFYISSNNTETCTDITLFQIADSRYYPKGVEYGVGCCVAGNPSDVKPIIMIINSDGTIKQGNTSAQYFKYGNGIVTYMI